MKEQTMSNTTANREIKKIGIDLAKTSFQLYAEDESERKVVNRKMTKKKLKEFMCRQLPCGVAMEACGIGTERQMRRQYVKPPSVPIYTLSQLKRVDNKIFRQSSECAVNPSLTERIAEQDEQAQRLMTISGIANQGATALLAGIRGISTFKSSREIAA
jgi:transposase